MKFCALLILSLLTVLFTHRKSKIISYAYAVLLAFFFYVSIFLGELGIISQAVEKIIGVEHYGIIYESLTSVSEESGISYSAYELVQLVLTAIILVSSLNLVIEVRKVTLKHKNNFHPVRDLLKKKIANTQNVVLWEKRYLVCTRLLC